MALPRAPREGKALLTLYRRSDRRCFRQTTLPLEVPRTRLFCLPLTQQAFFDVVQTLQQKQYFRRYKSQKSAANDLGMILRVDEVFPSILAGVP